MSKSEKAASRVVFVCQECGKESLKWLGRCPDCQQWNSFVEMTVKAEVTSFQEGQLHHGKTVVNRLYENIPGQTP